MTSNCYYRAASLSSKKIRRFDRRSPLRNLGSQAPETIVASQKAVTDTMPTPRSSAGSQPILIVEENPTAAGAPSAPHSSRTRSAGPYRNAYENSQLHLVNQIGHRASSCVLVGDQIWSHEAPDLGAEKRRTHVIVGHGKNGLTTEVGTRRLEARHGSQSVSKEGQVKLQNRAERNLFH
jgi:hypothetical protein